MRRAGHRVTAACLAALGLCAVAAAEPFIPRDDQTVLAELPAGTRHADAAASRAARSRIDVAVPLAQFYIGQARSTGDLRFLGYAESVLAPWVAAAAPLPAVLVLQATLQQGRHEFAAALATLDRALAIQAQNPQAWLTRATVLRVLGRYDEAAAACAQVSRWADPGIAAVCARSVEALRGHLKPAFTGLAAVSTQGMPDLERSWRDAELGDMAVRLGQDPDAEYWYRAALSLNPHDGTVRAALADLLLRGHRPQEVMGLLQDEEGNEPLLLRRVLAQRELGDPAFVRGRDLLRAAFAAEAARGEAVHQREQARYLLELEGKPEAALQAALANWVQQREPDDILVLIRAARACASPAAAPALDVVRAQGLEDVRLITAVKAAS